VTYGQKGNAELREEGSFSGLGGDFCCPSASILLINYFNHYCL